MLHTAFVCKIKINIASWRLKRTSFDASERIRQKLFSFYRAMLCIRDTSHGPVSFCLSQVGVLSKRLNESSWFLASELPSTRPTLC